VRAPVGAEGLVDPGPSLAAHATAREAGFRPSDARFFGYLFANWLERDVLYPGEVLDLTQVRRLLLRLVSLAWARKPSARAAAKERAFATR